MVIIIIGDNGISTYFFIIFPVDVENNYTSILFFDIIFVMLMDYTAFCGIELCLATQKAKIVLGLVNIPWPREVVIFFG